MAAIAYTQSASKTLRGKYEAICWKVSLAANSVFVLLKFRRDAHDNVPLIGLMKQYKVVQSIHEN